MSLIVRSLRVLSPCWPLLVRRPRLPWRHQAMFSLLADAGVAIMECQVEDSTARGGLLSSQRFSDDWLSPEVRPSRMFRTLMSSSRSGQ